MPYNLMGDLDPLLWVISIHCQDPEVSREREVCRARQVLHVGPVAAERPGTDPSVSRAKAANPRVLDKPSGADRTGYCGKLIPSEGL